MEQYLKRFSLPYELLGRFQFARLSIDLRESQPEIMTFAGSPDFLRRCADLESISTVVTNESSFREYKNGGRVADKAFIVVENPKNYFFKFHNFLARETEFYVRSKSALSVGKGSRVSKLASLPETNVVIGENVVIEDFVKIHENVFIGDNSRIQAGAVIGNDCLQCIQVGEELCEIDHVGGVRIGKGVKVESNSLVCRDVFSGDTSIGDGSKIGGLVHVSHGCKIGRRSILTANILLGGGTTIGDDVFIGPNVTTAPLIQVGDGSRLTLGSVVTRDVSKGEHVTGNFAIAHEKFVAHMRSIR